ncbi:hypothetical protein [Hoeflea sp. TYP-13]|uniref:hypothetical protein n=1 Tax=Hoeflea sp. TYP-13 TaxID=3230023 RepID=UPI0034C5D263
MFEGTLGVFPGQLFEKPHGFLSKPFDFKQTYQKIKPIHFLVVQMTCPKSRTTFWVSGRGYGGLLTCRTDCTAPLTAGRGVIGIAANALFAA